MYLGRFLNISYKNMNSSFFVLNIRSLSKHLIDVRQDMYAERSDHICLVETWLDPAQTNITKLQLAGRSFDHASLGKGKGCAIFSTTSRNSNFSGKIVTEKYQILSIIAKEVQLVLVYISKNCSFEELKLDLVKLLKSEKKQVITGDFNFDKDEKKMPSQNILGKKILYNWFILLHCNPLQGQYRVEFTTQGKPCFHCREPLFSLQGPCIHHRESCIHYREFPVRITTQGNPCSHYREWVCSVLT